MDVKLERTETSPPQKQPYEPPQAIFVPLKIEERLMGNCAKAAMACAPANVS